MCCTKMFKGLNRVNTVVHCHLSRRKARMWPDSIFFKFRIEDRWVAENANALPASVKYRKPHVILHRVSKNVPPLACYKFDTRE